MRHIDQSDVMPLKGKAADGGSLVVRNERGDVVRAKTWAEVKAEGHPFASILDYVAQGYQSLADENYQIVGMFETKPKSIMDRWTLDLNAKPSRIEAKTDPLTARLDRNGKPLADKGNGRYITSDDDFAFTGTMKNPGPRYQSPAYKSTNLDETPILDSSRDIFVDRLGFADNPTQHGSRAKWSDSSLPGDGQFRIRIYVPDVKQVIVVDTRAALMKFDQIAETRGWVLDLPSKWWKAADIPKQ